MYPVLKEGVSIGTFQYEDSDTTNYYIENAEGDEFEISYRLWDVSGLDGESALSAVCLVNSISEVAKK